MSRRSHTSELPFSIQNTFSVLKERFNLLDQGMVFGSTAVALWAIETSNTLPIEPIEFKEPHDVDFFLPSYLLGFSHAIDDILEDRDRSSLPGGESSLRGINLGHGAAPLDVVAHFSHLDVFNEKIQRNRVATRFGEIAILPPEELLTMYENARRRHTPTGIIKMLGDKMAVATLRQIITLRQGCPIQPMDIDERIAS